MCCQDEDLFFLKEIVFFLKSVQNFYVQYVMSTSYWKYRISKKFCESKI